MPKPVRSNDFSVGFGRNHFFEGDDGDMHGLGDVLEGVNRSLLIESKPKTPMDLIQADFPSTPSSVYSNRLQKSKQQETSRFVNTQEDEPPMSPGGQHSISYSPTNLKSSSSTEIRDDVSAPSPRKGSDFSVEGALGQATAGMINLQVSSYPNQPSMPPRGLPQHMSQQHMMMQQQHLHGGQVGMGAYMGPGYGGGYNGAQNMGMQPQYAQHQSSGYMQQMEPAIGGPPNQFYMQQGGGIYGSQMYYGATNGMNAGNSVQMQYQPPARGPYGDQGGYVGVYGDPHQQMQQQWDGGVGMDEASGRGMGQQQVRSAGGMMYPQHHQLMPPQGSMYSGPGGMPSPLSAGNQNMSQQSQMWGGPSPPGSLSHMPQQINNQVHSAPARPNAIPYSQTLIQGLGSSVSDSGAPIVAQRGVGGGRGLESSKEPRRPVAGGSIGAHAGGRGGNSRAGSNGKMSASSSATAVSSTSGASRDHLVEEFRNTFGKSKQWEIKDLVGHIVSFCQDQHGSRFIQQRLEVAPDAEKQLVFDELVPCAQSLMTDVFGNYVIQKLFEFGTPDQCEMLASMLMGQAVTLAMQMYGCRVIQKALEYVNTERLVALVGEFEGQQVLRCVHDQNGNHVIQKCIEVVCRVARDSSPAKAEFMSSKIQFIIFAFHGRVRELSMHPYGCRVVQRILEHCPNSQKAPVLEELRKCCNELVQDQYGNYVIQHVMQHGWDTDKAMLIKEVQSNLLDYSQHKFASNVVEKCLQFAHRKDRDEMIWTIINVTFDMNQPVDVNTGQCVLESMVRDPYANYVVQKVIDVSDERQRGAIVRYVKENIVQLRRYTYGKHIIVRLEKVCNEKF